MTDLNALVNNTSVSRTGLGWTSLRATPDGALYTTDVGGSLGIEGRIFAANMGLVTTPLATAATTAIVNTTPHAWIRVPDGTAIVPLYARIVVESQSITTQGEISLLIAQNDIGNGTSSAADAGPINLNTAAPVTSACTARQLATGAATAPTNPLELTRFSFAASAVNQAFEWDARSLGVFAVVRGEGSWAIYIGGNAVNYYAQMVWAELSEADID